MDLVGSKIGSYEVLSLLGTGGTAEVYQAMQPSLRRKVAIKLLLEEVSGDPDWVRRFELETQLLGKLDHPHILPIYDAGEHDGRPYFVMKYFGEGVTLRELMSGRPWPVAKCVKVITQLADALQAAHDAGIIHRDIKPSNILVTPGLHCLVFDFGIAKPARRAAPSTDAGMIVGTPEYMSPEQCKGDPLDHRSDIYSLGVLMYQMLTGRAPFTAETAVGVLMKHITEPLPLPLRGVEVPHPVNAVLKKALSRSRDDRFDSAGELAEAFRRAAEQRDTITLNLSELEDALAPQRSWFAVTDFSGIRGVRWWLVGAFALVFAVGLLSIQRFSNEHAKRVRVAGVPTIPLDDETEAMDPDLIPVQATPAIPAPPPAPAPGSKPVQFGTLTIESSEPAIILLNGETAGMAPATLPEVHPGRYRVELDAGAGRVNKKNVIVTTGSSHVLKFDFSETPADLSWFGDQESEPTQTPALSKPAPSSRTGTRPSNSTDPVSEIQVWTGFLTDEECGIRGSKQGGLHVRCAEKCIREGKRPYLYANDTLYPLVGLERIQLIPGEALTFRGRLAADGSLRVISEVSTAQ